MDLTGRAARSSALAATVATRRRGGRRSARRTQWETGNPPRDGASRSRAPAGVVALRARRPHRHRRRGHDVRRARRRARRARPGVPARPARRRPRPSAASSPAGCPGIRRLRHGPLRDHVLEVRFVTADGRLVKGGGPTVKNVTGYDLPRLLVGSFGTLGVLVQLTLRCRPARRACARWFRSRRAAPTASAPRRCCGTAGEVRSLLEGRRRRRRRAVGRARPRANRRALPDRRAPRPHLGRRPARCAALGARARRAARRALVRRARRRHRARRRRRRGGARRRPAPSPTTHDGWLLREARRRRDRRLRPAAPERRR